VVAELERLWFVGAPEEIAENQARRALVPGDRHLVRDARIAMLKAGGPS